MLYTISVIAQKGGSGKTTLALTLAVAVEQASRTAVVLDIDSQATACKWSARRAAETPLVLAVQPARLPGALETVPETLQVLSLARAGVSAVVVLSEVAARGPRTDQARTALTSSGLRVCPSTLGYRAASW